MVGAERTDEFTVEGRLLTDVGGTIPVKVLSTPGMIGMMERTAAMLALDHLEDGKATVGFELCVKHVAGAHEGARCTSTATLREVVDGRKWRCNRGVSRPLGDCRGAQPPWVRERDRTLGVGTHERRVVQRS